MSKENFEEVYFNTSQDSFNELLHDNEDFKLDLHGLLEEDSVIPIPSNEHTAYDSGIQTSGDPSKQKMKSPLKKDIHSTKGISICEHDKISLDTPNLFLRPNANENNIIANELFQVTNCLRSQTQSELSDMFGTQDDEYDDLFYGKRLNNDKIDKLVNDLGLKNQGDEIDFELDDQVRTGIFKGRFKKNQYIVDNNNNNDDIDELLTGYLGNNTHVLNDNKENLTPYPDPLKTIRNKNTNSIKKSNKVFFKAPRRNGTSKSSIPVLKPLSNVTNIELKKSNNEFVVRKDNAISPKRVCTPNHSGGLMPSRPSIKYQKPLLNIYLVDSLTGHINDATQFGTELNASNCEGFPLPENANEIVQIPTNDDSQVPSAKKNQQKMAIIKAFQNKYFSPNNNEAVSFGKRPGFYNREELEIYKQNLPLQSSSGVQVINQVPSENKQISAKTKLSKPKVKWADNLEW